MLSNFKSSQPVKKLNDQSHKIFVKNMAFHLCTELKGAVGGAINGTKKAQSGRKNDWFLSTNYRSSPFSCPPPMILGSLWNNKDLLA